MTLSQRILSLAVACAAAAALPLPAMAEAPLQKTQAPGWHRFMVGDIEVTTLSDGTVRLPVLNLLRGDRARLAEALRRGYLGEQVETSINGFLVNTGGKLVLIDTGTGGGMAPSAGVLLANLRAAGYQPEQVDEIYITHLHGDHVGGLLAAGAPAFPRAVVRMDKREADFWLSEANMNAAPAPMKGFFQTAMAAVGAYEKAGRLKTFDGGTELVPGVRSVAAYGHTPGHSTYTIESKGDKLVLWGDLMHVAAVQFDDPAVTIQFDSDSNAAAAQRKQAYEEAARNGWLVGAAHLSFPGVGRLRANGAGGYTYLPLNYSGLK